MKSEVMTSAISMAAFNNRAQSCADSHHRMIVVHSNAIAAHATPWFALPQLTAVCRNALLVASVSPLGVMQTIATRSARVETVGS